MPHYQIGKVFPDIAPYEDISGGRVTFTEDSFNIILGLDAPTQKEIQSFNGTLFYGAYIFEMVPFFCIRTLHFTTAFSMNFLKVRSDIQPHWLNSKDNVIFLFLVDSDTHILKGWRAIEVPWMSSLREVLGKQMCFDKATIDDWIRNIEMVLSVNMMADSCTFHSAALPL